ncbi:MAG: MFS transporter [Pseudomonadota bacterium]
MTATTWRTPGAIVVAGCLLTIVAFGTRATFGLFLEPMTLFHGWTREDFALAMAVQNLLWGAAQPFAGALADRHGAGRVIAAGLVAYAVGVACMAVSDTPLWLLLSGGILVGLAQAFASYSIVLAAFARLLPEAQRSWAFGVGTAAGSLGQFLMVPLGQAFIMAFGWFDALLLLAAGLVIVLPLAFVLHYVPLQLGRGGAVAAPLPAGEALSAAVGHRSFLLLTAGFFVCGFHVAFIGIHLPAYLGDQGFGPGVGAAAIALIGLFNVIGAYASGVIGTRHSKKTLLCWIYLARSVVLLAFVALPVTTVSVYLFAAAMGILWLSTVPPTSGLVALMFGVRNMAMLFGVVFFSHQVGAFLGVWLGGWLFDATGSYDVVWWLAIALGLFAAAVHWPIREAPAPSPAVQPAPSGG